MERGTLPVFPPAPAVVPHRNVPPALAGDAGRQRRMRGTGDRLLAGQALGTVASSC